MTPNDNDDDKDLTRIEDLPPHDHPPLPKLPDHFPETFNEAPELPNTPSHETLFPEAPVVAKEIPTPTEEDSQLFDAMNVEEVQSEPEQVPSFEEEKSLVSDFSLPKMQIAQPEIKINDSAKYFSDVKEEMETFVVKHVAFESYPSFSLLVRDIKSNLQKREIQLMLQEYSLMQSDVEKSLVERSLTLGHLLIPRISEYAAIFFCNKLELLNLKIKMAPSDDLNSPDNVSEMWDRGPVTEESFHHHKEEGQSFLQTVDIFISTLTNPPGKEIQMLGEMFHQTLILPISIFQNLSGQIDDLIDRLNDLKLQAKNFGANAILGLEIKVLQKRQEEIQLLITGEAALIHDIR